MTFTYHFRPGVKWSDGEPFTAEDAAWTYTYYKENGVPNYSADLALMDTAVATDDTTMVLTSKKPTSFYSGDSVFLYDYILPKHIWDKFQDDYKGAKQETGFPSVGTGPYIITDYVKNQFVQLDRNPNYWGIDNGMTPKVDQIIYRIYGNQDAEAAALQSGEVDFGYFSSANILNTLESRGLETRGAAVPSFGEIGINTGSGYQTDPAGGFKPHGDGHPALQDVVLRQAMRRAVDNQVLVDKVLLGYGTPGISPVQPGATTGAWEPGPTIRICPSTSPRPTRCWTTPATRWDPMASASTRRPANRSSSGSTAAPPIRTRSTSCRTCRGGWSRSASSWTPRR